MPDELSLSVRLASEKLGHEPCGESLYARGVVVAHDGAAYRAKAPEGHSCKRLLYPGVAFCLRHPALGVSSRLQLLAISGRLFWPEAAWAVRRETSLHRSLEARSAKFRVEDWHIREMHTSA